MTIPNILKRPELLFASSCLLAACTSHAPGHAADFATVDTTAGGTIVTTNRGPTAWADTNGWRLVLEQVIGQGDSDTLLTPHAVVALTSGQIVVLERTPPRLVVYSPEGQRLGSIGREGAGPGEFASGGLLMALGDTIIHHDRRQSRVQRFLADATLLGGWAAPCCVSQVTLADTLGRIPIPTVTRPRAGDEPPWAGGGYIRFNSRGEPLDTLVPPHQPPVPMWDARTATGRALVAVPLAPVWRATFTPGGEWVHGTTDRLRFAITDARGDTLRLISADAPRWPIADSVRQAALDEIVAQNPALRTVARLDDVPTTYPAWSDLAVDGSGNLWVLASGPTGQGDHWLVFDRDGRLAGAVPAPFREAVRMFWTRDRVYVVARDGSANGDEVRVYRIERATAGTANRTSSPSP